MKVLEVSTLHAGINQVLSNLWKQREQLKQIEGSIQAIVDLQDSFKGEGGQAIRGFFQSYHLSFLQDLFSFYNRYIETLEQIQNNLMGDHAGHIAADRFGGSPELDNLVSQSSSVNLSKYKKLENKWARAIEEGKHVSVNVKINYQGNNVRPSGFDVEYEINGRMSFASIEN